MRKYITHPLGVFIVVFHAIYFLIAFKTGNIYLVDSYGYLHQVKNLLEHQSWYAEDWNSPVFIDYFTIRPPLYALFILVCKSVFASDIFVLFIQNIFSLFNIFLLWKMLAHFSVKQKIINIAIITTLLFFPSQFIHANFVMSEILFQTLLLLSFYFSVKVLQTKKWEHMLAVTVFISLCMLTKPVIFLFGIFLFIFFAVVFWKQYKKILVPFLLLPLTYHVLCLQNQHTTGYYHYSSIKIMADLRINTRYIIAQKYGADSSAKLCTKIYDEANLMPDYESHYKHIEQSCNEVYTQNKTTFAMLYLKGVASTVFDPGRFDLSLFYGLQNNVKEGLLQKLNKNGSSSVSSVLQNTPLLLLIYLLLILVWNIVLFCCFIAFVLNKKIDLLIRILVFIFVGYIVATTGISGLCRYRVPVFPEIIFAFSFVLPQIISYLNNKFSNHA